MSEIGRKTWLVERHVVQYQFVEAPDADTAAVRAVANTVSYGQSRHTNAWANDPRTARVVVREVKRKPPKRAQHR